MGAGGWANEAATERPANLYRFRLIPRHSRKAGRRGQPRPFCPRSAGMWLIGQNGLAWASLASHNAESIPFSFSRWSDTSLEHSTHVQGIYRNLYYIASRWRPGNAGSNRTPNQPQPNRPPNEHGPNRSPGHAQAPLERRKIRLPSPPRRAARPRRPHPSWASAGWASGERPAAPAAPRRC